MVPFSLPLCQQLLLSVQSPQVLPGFKRHFFPFIHYTRVTEKSQMEAVYHFGSTVMLKSRVPLNTQIYGSKSGNLRSFCSQLFPRLCGQRTKRRFTLNNTVYTLNQLKIAITAAQVWAVCVQFLFNWCTFKWFIRRCMTVSLVFP